MRGRWLLVLLAATGCEYDIDKIYEHPVPDAGEPRVQVPAQLIDLYEAQPVVDEDCVRCAKRSCRDANEECRADPTCVATTRCFAEGLNPSAQASCREERLDWFKEDLLERGLADPFYTCVFRDRCAAACDSSTSWACLKGYSWGSTRRSTLSLELELYEGRVGTKGADIQTKVCAVLEDTVCGGQAPVSDADGRVLLELPTPSRSFQGYLELTGEGWYPTLIRFGWPMTRDGALRMGIVNEANIAANIALSGIALDEARGLLQLRIYGCAGVGMEGVSFTAKRADERSVTWYYDGSVNTDIDATTDWGNGGILNVPAGLTRIDARRDGELVASTYAPVRAGFLTIVIMTPLPR